MPTVELDQDVYDYIARNTKVLGEDASSILRRLLELSSEPEPKEPKIAESNSGQNNSEPKSAQRPQERTSDYAAVALSEILDLPKKGRDWEGSKVGPGSSSQHEEANVEELSRKPVARANHEQRGDTVSFLRSNGFLACDNVTDRYIEALRWIHFQHQQEFDRISKIKGKKRVYFSQSQSEIANSGHATHPRKIDGTRWYALTNNSSANKRELLKQVMCLLHYPAEDVKMVTDAIVAGK